MDAKTTVKKSPAKKTAAKTQNNNESSVGKLAILQVRGVINAKEDIIMTMGTLLLRQKLACSVWPATPVNMAAAMKCKDYTTYGIISDETHQMLIDKRGEKGRDGKIKKYFRLHPPRGGFERKGVKLPFTMGGALGNRGEKMNDLIKKML